MASPTTSLTLGVVKTACRVSPASFSPALTTIVMSYVPLQPDLPCGEWRRRGHLQCKL